LAPHIRPERTPLREHPRYARPVDLDFAVLADGVVARPDGKLDILGAGFDTIWASTVPAQHQRLVLAVRVLV
jgi:hypothetical protein